MLIIIFLYCIILLLFQGAIDGVSTCVENIELGSDTFCQLIRKNYAKCTKPIRDIVVGCLPPESRDLPLLGEKIIGAIIDQVCNSTVEEILGKFHNGQTSCNYVIRFITKRKYALLFTELFNPCVMEKELDEVAQCGDIKKTFIQHKNELPSKSLICG